ncbi:NAD-dependent epimerase/dehydratase family protein [Haloferax mediterranei ATCC 33500]|uniref:NAD-dependent epimerase/dehydratase family protein n=1 Tax=Haloferax mediterranei (strain ATCC 33500 / DSM 1411 / JCM 8866 / NBRC 14739 / NCIMB 2177 / R-4) TaxID=523841 RepID=I3R0T6_HALMT|nr:NAD(P)H-binding protein [Haloferax mediterranei]AFK17846.1 NADH dehydrogenase 32K chain-like protein [Haloferax mediterranei ATCC 33500]EMA02881.1 NADH dehydrogenase 32K chain-like protein [Haloferax mediterranei ATCC 33500]MDX5987934.1 NAD(P)H-binding protein [Haloferax mediterranei ATCC 33500]QCQ74404.1 NAD-dependent epimerase/dehydratase family protein [Haloferax mediterranei ATCC 33500]
MRVLVTGATGFVGRHLVPALLDAGHDVVVFVRDAERYDGPDEVEVVEGDVFEPETIAPAMEGVDAAYYLIHSMQSGGDFEARDRLAARNFINAASAEGVERVVYLGGLGEERDRLSPHLRSRREVEHILASSSPELTTLRAAIIVGAGSASFDMVRQLAKRLPVMVTPQWVETRCQPIAIRDVVAYLVGVLDHPETAGETYEIGGPDVLTYREMLLRVGEHLGQSPKILPVPVLTPRLSSYWIGLVTDVDTGVARPLIEGLKNPVVVTDDRIRDIVEVDETPFDVAVERALLEEERESTTVTVETPTTAS